MPKRVQLRRSKGWRKPAGAVVVARPSRWGNPSRVGVDGDRARCAGRFRHALFAGELAFTLDDVRQHLAGRDLACWCPLDEPCHADVLLVAANTLIAIDDPLADDIRALLTTHLQFSRAVTPPGHVHALDVDGLLDPAVTFFSARHDGTLMAIGALKQLDATHAELKSMHTAELARGNGIGRAMVDHLLRVARERKCTRVSLETGTMVAFAPARSLYANAGFMPCEPFGGYTSNPHSVCMTRQLDS